MGPINDYRRINIILLTRRQNMCRAPYRGLSYNIIITLSDTAAVNDTHTTANIVHNTW